MAEPRNRYSTVSLVLHWLIAALVVTQVALVAGHEAIEGDRTFLDLHKSVGLGILVLTLVRLGWRIANPALPLHGFARTADWSLKAITADGPNRTRVTLSLADSSASRVLWNQRFALTLQATIGASLEIALTTRNAGVEPFTISQAIHTYFNISHVGNVTITGYDGVDYVDKVGGANRPDRQVGDITINREIDAVFQNCPGASAILDTGFKRRLTIAKQGSNSAVVWNPWIEKAKKLSGYTPESYQTMVCVETCNALADARTILPGAEHCLKAIIAASRLD